MKNIDVKMKRYKLVSIVVFAIAYILFIASFTIIDNKINISSTAIFIFSWIGIITTISYFLVWKRITGKFFIPFIIFLGFVAVFNFGQCFLWAFNIHGESEIGKTLIFSSIYADNILILKAQILYIISFIALNTGAIFVLKDNPNLDINFFRDNNKKSDKLYKAVYMTSVFTAAISIPITLYVAYYRFIYSQLFSYHDLYYGEISNFFDNPILSIGSQLFAISLIGLLIGSRYAKRTKNFVYFIFILYAIITLLAGDRGEWLKPGIFLFWMHVNLYKPMKPRKMLLLFVLGIIFLYIINPIVELRNVGLTLSGFIEGLKSGNSIIKSMFLEFGNTMGISIILLKNNLTSPYGNTFLMSIPTMFGTGLANKLFGWHYYQIHTWFPLYYLKISYGTDFSIIGEALLNYGAFATPIVLIIEGLIFGKIFNNSLHKLDNPLLLCLGLNLMITAIGISRSTTWIFLNNSLYSTLVFTTIYFVILSLINQRLRTKTKDNDL